MSTSLPLGCTDLNRAWKSSEARFHAIVDRSADGVVVIGNDGKIRFANPAAEEMLGRSYSDLIGEIFGIPLAPGNRTEVQLIHRRGERRIAEMCVVETEWQQQPAYLATFRDISAHKRLEEEKEEALRCRDRFLAALSHELRNPLAAITSAGELLDREIDDNYRSRRAVETIHRESRLMARLLDDLLDVCRVSQGKIDLKTSVIDLVDIIVESAQAAAPRLQQAELNFHCSIPPVLLYIQGDTVRLQQIFVNLLHNAAKFTPAGGDVWLEVVQEDMKGVVRIRDNGIGIPQEKIKAIFEPFVQALVAPRQAESGLGIGLSLVRSFIQMHGGTVEAFSKGPGLGSEFVLSLPLVDAPRDGVSEKEEKPPLPLRTRRILLIEDNESAREMLKALLELDGHEVFECGEGKTGISLLEKHLPDLALIDIGLPDQDGYQIAAAIRKKPHLASVYLVALTGYGQAEDRRAALEAGFDTHLTKPLHSEEFNRLLRSLPDS